MALTMKRKNPAEDNGIEIIRSVQLQPGDGLVTAPSGVGIEAHEADHVCKPSSEETHLSGIVIPLVNIKPSSNLPSWGILPPVEETKAKVRC